MISERNEGSPRCCKIKTILRLPFAFKMTCNLNLFSVSRRSMDGGRDGQVTLFEDAVGRLLFWPGCNFGGSFSRGIRGRPIEDHWIFALRMQET